MVACQKDHKKIRVQSKDHASSYQLPNDEFREKVLPKFKYEKNKSTIITILNSLDKKNVSFCEVVKREYEIDDSCYAIALAKYPDPNDQTKLLKLHNDIYDKKQTNYLKQIGITERQADLLTTAYAFDENVKNFCGKY
jgi:hypothetical protein